MQSALSHFVHSENMDVLRCHFAGEAGVFFVKSRILSIKRLTIKFRHDNIIRYPITSVKFPLGRFTFFLCLEQFLRSFGGGVFAEITREERA